MGRKSEMFRCFFPPKVCLHWQQLVICSTKFSHKHIIHLKQSAPLPLLCSSWPVPPSWPADCLYCDKEGLCWHQRASSVMRNLIYSRTWALRSSVVLTGETTGRNVSVKPRDFKQEEGGDWDCLLSCSNCERAACSPNGLCHCVLAN